MLVLQNNSSHYTLDRVKCDKQILLPVGFEPTTTCIRGKRHTARPQECFKVEIEKYQG